MGERDEPFLVQQIPPAIAELAALGASVEFHQLAGKTHGDLVVDFDTDADQVTPLLAAFVHAVTH